MRPASSATKVMNAQIYTTTYTIGVSSYFYDFDGHEPSKYVYLEFYLAHSSLKMVVQEGKKQWASLEKCHSCAPHIHKHA